MNRQYLASMGFLASVLLLAGVLPAQGDVLYVTSPGTGNGSIQRIDSLSNVSTFASFGAYDRPVGLTFSSVGNLFVSDSIGNGGNPVIYRYDSSGSRSVFTTAGLLAHPGALAFNTSGNLYVCNADR